MIFFKDNAPIGAKTPTVLNHQAFRLKFMGELRLMVAAAATSGMIRMSGDNLTTFASGCSGKRLDCWTLDLVLGVHLTFHCYLCILARLRDSRLGDEIEILSSCLLLMLPSESLQNCDCQILSITLAGRDVARKFKPLWLEVISGFATMTIGSSPQIVDLGDSSEMYVELFIVSDTESFPISLFRFGTHFTNPLFSCCRTLDEIGK